MIARTFRSGGNRTASRLLGACLLAAAAITGGGAHANPRHSGPPSPLSEGAWNPQMAVDACVNETRARARRDDFGEGSYTTYAENKTVRVEFSIYYSTPRSSGWERVECIARWDGAILRAPDLRAYWRRMESETPADPPPAPSGYGIRSGAAGSSFGGAFPNGAFSDPGFATRSGYVDPSAVGPLPTGALSDRERLLVARERRIGESGLADAQDGEVPEIAFDACAARVGNAPYQEGEANGDGTFTLHYRGRGGRDVACRVTRGGRYLGGAN